MPCGKYFDFTVYTGVEELEEYNKDGEIFIEAKLDAKCTYKMATSQIVKGENESQEWPVTPYKIEIITHSNSPTMWYELYVDGIYVWNKPLSGGMKWSVEGYTSEGIHRELLFSLPRFTANNNEKCEAERKDKLGTITIRCILAIPNGTCMQPMTRVRDFSNNMMDCDSQGFRQSSKSDCGSKGMGSTASGREMFRFVESKSAPKMRCIKRYRRGSQRDEITINYRMRPVLEDMGLMSKEIHSSNKEICHGNVAVKREQSSTEIKTECTTPEKQAKTDSNLLSERLRPGIKQEEGTCDEFQSAIDDIMNRFSSMSTKQPIVQIKREIVEVVETRLNDNGEQYDVVVRKEMLPTERAIVIDEDIALIECLDESVVCIGDDDCYLLDPPVKEFPIVSL